MPNDPITLIGALITLAICLWPVISALANSLYERILSRLPAQQHQVIQSAVNRAVASVEQLSGVADAALRIPPDQRRQKALEAAQGILAHFGLHVPDTVLLTYIEDAVRALPNSGYSGNFDYNPAAVVPASVASPPAVAQVFNANPASLTASVAAPITTSAV